jgi:hypothetical protein
MNVKLAGLDLRIAGYAADIQACWEVVPVLRYVAREPIRGELAWVSGSGLPRIRLLPGIS